MLQNAVDAIRKRKTVEKFNAYIKIIVDASKKTISVEDNGIAIPKSDIGSLLKPFSTNKESSDKDSVGEKGVGLTFIMFLSNYFEIITGQGNNAPKAIIATVEGAANWIKSDEEALLPLIMKDLTYHFQGTKVTVRDLDIDTLFNLNFEQLKYVIRTKTSIGNTKSIWEEDIDIRVELEYRDQNLQYSTAEIPFRYLLIPEILDPKNIITVSDFKKNYGGVEKTDIEKRRALMGKVIVHKGIITHTNNSIIKYYLYYLPTRKSWNQKSVDLGLLPEDKEEMRDYISKYHYALLEPGIYTSVKGMPTGIKIRNPSTFAAGYWSNLFILFEDNSLKFDIGRKSIHGSQSNKLQKYARKIFNDFQSDILKFVTNKGIIDYGSTLDEIFDEIEDRVDLNSNNTVFEKSPKGQEAQVSAMFYEQVGKGLFNGTDIRFKSSGYKGRYDLYSKWNSTRIAIEFKSSLKHIFDDFNDLTKLFDEITCVVCWDVKEEDKQACKDHSVAINDVFVPAFGKNTKTFPHATHILEIGYSRPIYVIDLKTLID